MNVPNLVHLIFGMKVRQARTEAGLSLSELAARCDLSPSYLTEIEKGRKYPKPDKIMKMAQALGKEYDALVSIKLAPSLAYLETLLASPLLRQFPYQEFELELGDLLNLFTRAPDKASALVHAILEIGRQYDMRPEHFLRAVLRSYQEIHDNYFEDLEDAATRFAREYDLSAEQPLRLDTLRRLITAAFGYDLDEERLSHHPLLKNYRSVYIAGQKPKLLLNAALKPSQLKFLLAREMAYVFLSLKPRSHTSAPDKVGDSFQQILNDFRAAYFAGALLMPRSLILSDLQAFFQLNTWSPYRLLRMLDRYDVTPEMLFYRFSELIPQFFGVKLHFLRFQNAAGKYRLVKYFNMNNLQLPNGLNLREHHCRRWLSVRLLRETEGDPAAGSLIARAQISEFLASRERFLEFGFVRPLALTPSVASSVVIGFRIDPDLRRIVRFAEDPALPTAIIGDTCERCPLREAECAVRAAPPTVLEEERLEAERRSALKQLRATLQE